jgi:nitrous oxidase accessory protein NosD
LADGAAGARDLASRVVRRSVLSAFVLLGLLSPAAAGADPQTWVSGVGDDVNPCTRTAPCKTFAGAISKTDAGGTISALDGGGFGAVTITKSITIDGGGLAAGVLASSGAGITVMAGAADQVVLRGLSIESIPPCTAGANVHGIRFVSGRSLHVDRVTVRGFPGAAIGVEPSADGGAVTISNSDLRDNCTAGVLARRAAGNVGVLLSHSFLAGNGTGVLAGDGSTVRITGNTIAANGVGLASEPGGTLESFADNRVAGNVTDGVPTITRRGTPPPVPPALPPTVSGPVLPVCTVPKLIGLRLASIGLALARAKCGLGRVGYRYRLRLRRAKRSNRAYAQFPHVGTRLLAGTPVSFTIDGRRPVRRPKARAAAGGASRTWVSGVGDDANPCSRTAPCKTFAGAYAKTAAGGTINVLDAGDFGPIAIGGSIAIDGTGSPARILVGPGTTAVDVATAAGEDVILRNLSIVSTPGCSAPGAGHGIHFAGGGRLHVEHVSVRGFAGSGLALEPSSSRTATVRGGHFADNCTAGISAHMAGGTIQATVEGAVIAHNGTGVLADAGAVVRLTDSTVSGNGTGLTASGGGIIQGWSDNAVGGNMTDGVTPIPLAFT